MSERRNNYQVIDTYEDAMAWWEEFGHTVTDEAVRRVMEVFRGETSDDLEAKDNEISRLEEQSNDQDQEIRDLKEEIADLKARLEEAGA